MDDTDWLQETIELSEATNGRKPTPEEIAILYLAHGREKRGKISYSIKSSSRNREFTVRQAADRMPYERAISRAWDLAERAKK